MTGKRIIAMGVSSSHVGSGEAGPCIPPRPFCGPNQDGNKPQSQTTNHSGGHTLSMKTVPHFFPKDRPNLCVCIATTPDKRFLMSVSGPGSLYDIDLAASREPRLPLLFRETYQRRVEFPLVITVAAILQLRGLTTSAQHRIRKTSVPPFKQNMGPRGQIVT